MRQLETRVYVLDLIALGTKDHTTMTQEEFIKECENQGRVYSLKGFQNMFNLEAVNTATDVIKIVHTETTDTIYSMTVDIDNDETEINEIPIILN